ncbi:MAG TPA: hypothetical protein VFR81_06295 [Longimicrobium sp.]|nr:hypothetical protein [Longimicrobium sp.]
MRKLSLDLDGIRVETFETDGTAGARGTVHGRFGVAALAGDSPLASCVHSCEDTICYSCDTCREPCPSQVCETQEQPITAKGAA